MAHVPQIYSQEQGGSASGNHSHWAVSLAYAPRYAFSFNPDETSRLYRTYFLGFNLCIEQKIDTERVALSIGITYNGKHVKNSSGFTNTVTILEFPIEVKYHLKKKADEIDQYLITALVVSSFRENRNGIDLSQVSIKVFREYSPIADLGYGFIVKPERNFALQVEARAGYAILNVFPDRWYINLNVGGRFNLSHR